MHLLRALHSPFSVPARMEIPQPLFSLISSVGREGISRDLLVHLPLGFPFRFYIWFRPDKHILGIPFGHLAYSHMLETHESYETASKRHFIFSSSFHSLSQWAEMAEKQAQVQFCPHLSFAWSSSKKENTTLWLWKDKTEGLSSHLLTSQCHQVEHFLTGMDVQRKVTHKGWSMQSISRILNPKTDFKALLNPDTVFYFNVTDSRSLRTES